MAVTLKVKRGTSSKLPTLNIGEFGFATDTGELYIGSSSGNVKVYPPSSSGSGGLGYMVHLAASSINPAKNFTYYFGGSAALAPTPAVGRSYVVIPKSGTIKRADIIANITSVSSNTQYSVQFYLVINRDITNAISLGGTPFDLSVVSISKTLTTSVSAGDGVEIKMVTPNWTSLPTGVRLWGSLYVE